MIIRAKSEKINLKACYKKEGKKEETNWSFGQEEKKKKKPSTTNLRFGEEGKKTQQ